MSAKDLKLSTDKPVYSWANHDLSSDEYRMAKNVANLPFVYKHVALMPDVHLGKGALVGSVIATKDSIIPAAVGVDIGCGMCTIQTPFKSEMLEGKLKKIRQDIESAIPTGFNQNKDVDKDVYNWNGWQDFKTPPQRGAKTANQIHAPNGLPRRRKPLHRTVPRHRQHRLANAALRLPQHRK